MTGLAAPGPGYRQHRPSPLGTGVLDVQLTATVQVLVPLLLLLLLPMLRMILMRMA